MAAQSVVDYIKREKDKGLSDESITNSLREVGWQESDIGEAFDEYWKGRGSRPVKSQDLHPEELETTNKRLIQKFPFRFKLLFFTIVLLIGVTLVGVFFLELSPEKVLSEVYEKTKDLESVDYKLSANIKIDAPQGSLNTNTNSYSLSLSSEGMIVNYKDQESVSSQTVTLSIQNLLTTTFNIMNFGNDIYVKTIDFPDLGFIDPDLINNNWIYVNLKDYVSQGSEPEPLTKDQENEINEIVRDNPIIEVVEELDDETIDGFETYHYKYKINKDNLALFVKKISEMQNNGPLTEEETSVIDDVFERISFYDGDIFVDKNEKLTRQIGLAVKVRFGDSDYSEDMTIDSVWNFSNFNAGQTIERPQNFVKVEDIIEQLYKDNKQELPGVKNEFILPDSQMEPQSISFFSKLPKVLGLDDGN